MKKQTGQWDQLQPKDWFVQTRGELFGPLKEAEVRTFVLDQDLDPDTRVRQGESDYFPVSRIRDMFTVLQERGWYVLDRDTTFGPYTGDRLLTLVASGFFPAKRILVRQGTEGAWVSVKEAKRVFRRKSRNARESSAANRSGAQNRDANSILTHQSDRKSHQALPKERKPQHASPPAIPTNENWRIDTADDLVERQSSAASKTSRSDSNVRLSAVTVCSKCGRKEAGKGGICDRCAARQRKADAKMAKRNERRDAAGESSGENLIGKAIMLTAAFGTSGFFLSKWLVMSQLWKDFHTRDQQFWGWVCLAISLVLAVVGALAIWYDSDRRADRKLTATGAVALLLVSLVHYAGTSARLRHAERALQEQNLQWAEYMQQRGYDDR